MTLLLFAVAVVVLTVLAVGAVLLFSHKPTPSAQPQLAHAAPMPAQAANGHPSQPTEMARALHRELDEQEIADAVSRLRRDHQRRELGRIAAPSQPLTE